MAINYVLSFTFAPNTTISSSQVNTNFSDNANTWTGLEALTKTFSKLKVDGDPTTVLEVATKQYVDHYAAYRKPVLVYSSATVVNVETGLNGASGQVVINFPDGTQRTDSAVGRIQCNLAQVASLVATAQSGLRTGSVAANTWYAIYAVKSQVNTTDIVMVADTVLPLQSNVATLNSNFGTNAWVYLGLIRNGDQGGSTNVILSFVMAGHTTNFTNVTTFQNSAIGLGLQSGTATNITATYSPGTGAAQIPQNITLVKYVGSVASQTGDVTLTNQAHTGYHSFSHAVGAATLVEVWMGAAEGCRLDSGTSVALAILLGGFVDGVLGVGSNPFV